MAPHLKFEEAAFELLITLAIILNAISAPAGMAPPLARLSPARRAATADAHAEAPWNRRAGPAGTETNPVAEALDRLVCERHLARDGCPRGPSTRACAARPRTAIADHGSNRRSAITSATPSRSRCSIIGWSRSGRRCSSDLIVSVATIVGFWRRLSFVNTYGNWFTLVSAGFPALGTAVSGFASRPISAATRCARWRPPTRFARSTRSCARTSRCPAPRTWRSRREDHAVRPRRVAARQPAARLVGRLAFHECRDGVDDAPGPPGSDESE